MGLDLGAPRADGRGWVCLGVLACHVGGCAAVDVLVGNQWSVSGGCAGIGPACYGRQHVNLRAGLAEGTRGQGIRRTASSLSASPRADTYKVKIHARPQNGAAANASTQTDPADPAGHA